MRLATAPQESSCMFGSVRMLACVCARGARLQKRRRSGAAQARRAHRLRAVGQASCAPKRLRVKGRCSSGCRFIFGAPQDRTANRADQKGPTPGPSIVRLGGPPSLLCFESASTVQYCTSAMHSYRETTTPWSSSRPPKRQRRARIVIKVWRLEMEEPVFYGDRPVKLPSP